jgi:RHS repeat-associated protein
MFTKITQQCIYLLVMLSLLLTSLGLPATPAYAGFPPEDVPISDVPDPGPAEEPSPASEEGNAATGEGWFWLLSAMIRYWLGLIVGDPISAGTGGYFFDLPLLPLGGPTNLGFSLHYRSDFNQLIWDQAGLPELFWWRPLEHLEYSHGDPELGAYVTVQIRDGDAISFKRRGGQWVPTENGDFGYEDNVYPTRWLLQEKSSYFYLMDPIRQQVHIFEKVSQWEACIARIVDRNGNQLTYSYAGADELYPSRVEDGLGRSLDFTYQNVGGHPALVRVTDQAGRQVNLTHEPAGADNRSVWTLRSVTDPMGQTTTFRYQSLSGWYHLIKQVEQPKGNVPYRQTYQQVTLKGEQIPAVIAQADAYGHTTTLAYNSGAFRVTENRPDGATVTYEHHSAFGLPKSLTDATGKMINFSRDDATNRLTSVTDRLDDATGITYHAETGKIATYTDAEGRTTTYTYTAQDQAFTSTGAGLRRLDAIQSATFTFYDLTRITYPDATHEDFAYDEHGNVITQTNRLGQVWTYTYNERGQPLTITNPEGGVTTYTYNADATLASSTDSDVGTTTYGYDAYKRLNLITRPPSTGLRTGDGSTMRFTYDLNDRLLTVTDERDKTTTYTYDANGNRLTATDPLSQTVTYAYDLMDRLANRTDPLGHASTRTYDEMSRLETITDRNGHTTTYTYDLRGWRIGVTDPLSNTWATEYDDEGVPSATTTPLGFTTCYQTDKIGRTTVITDPLGAATPFTYDELGRLTSTTDRVGRSTDYDYDDAGWLVGVTKSGLGAATYTRNDLGLLTRITDLRGKSWDFGYSPMGRCTSHTDPLGNQWAYAYDARGRLQQTTYPDGGTATYTYDEDSNVTQIAYASTGLSTSSGGPTLEFTYDDAGRLLTANDITLTYDERGDVVNSQDEDGASFGATYDDGRRLKTVTYDGQATVTYAYDERDLLTRVEDDLTGAWMTFTYDDDGRLTVISRSNTVDTYFTYDNAGRVTRIEDVGPDDGWPPVADQQYTLNAEGEPIQVARILPLDPPPVGQAANLSYDDASQISSPGYAYDLRGRQTAGPGDPSSGSGRAFTYDGADRLTSITADGDSVDLTYNGLGDLRTRTTDGTITTYYHNYALGLAPIVAESEDLTGFQNLSGLASGYKRFYVYTPGGGLLYSIDPTTNEVRFYHFDRIGSTLFLTDESGAVTDAYGYDPYGNVLGHTGSSDQPFTYVGRYGVRWEPVGRLYHMGARVYDPAAARFLTRDPVWPVLSDAKGLNPYQYAYQNPMRYTDPLGTSALESHTWASLFVLARCGDPEVERMAWEEIRRREERIEEVQRRLEPIIQGRRQRLERIHKRRRFYRKLMRMVWRQRGPTIQQIYQEFPTYSSFLEVLSNNPEFLFREWSARVFRDSVPPSVGD